MLFLVFFKETIFILFIILSPFKDWDTLWILSFHWDYENNMISVSNSVASKISSWQYFRLLIHAVWLLWKRKFNKLSNAHTEAYFRRRWQVQCKSSSRGATWLKIPDIPTIGTEIKQYLLTVSLKSLCQRGSPHSLPIPSSWMSNQMIDLSFEMDNHMKMYVIGDSQ